MGDFLALLLAVAVIAAWAWPHSFGRCLGHIARGYRSAINDKDMPDADP
jgi:hypothetical protein